MGKFVKIPLTKKMQDDHKECAEMMDDGEEKECDGCSCNGGTLECLGEYPWCSD